MIINA